MSNIFTRVTKLIVAQVQLGDSVSSHIMNETLTALEGVRLGHATRLKKLTGVTVVTFDRPLPVAVCCRGGSPGTFNTDPFDSSRGGASAHAIFVSGGSYAGLQSGSEIMRELIAREIGFKSAAIVNPCVTGAIVMDLGVRIGQFNPSIAVEALDNAGDGPVVRGNVGAGTGAAVGKFYYPDQGKVFAGMKAGIGCARVDLRNGAFVVAMSVVNALGNVVGRDGSVLAGNRRSTRQPGFESFLDVIDHCSEASNTAISIIGTNVALRNGAEYQRMASLASHGHVRAINPVNLGPDGDTVFVFSTEEVDNLIPDNAGALARGSSWPQLTTDLVGQAAAEAVQESIYDACRSASTISFADALDGCIPSTNDVAS